MPETTARELKLIQYLNEAYGKEKELETALQAHIKLTTRAPYKKRLQEHLKETKGHARALERRIKQLGGKAELGVVAQVTDIGASVANKGVSLAKGQFHALRGTGAAEKMLKNAKTEYFNEHEEIATYIGIETLGESVGNTETAKLAREHRRQEERMASFLEKQIPILTKAVVTEEIPVRDRKPAGTPTPARRPAARRRTAASGATRTVNSRSRPRAKA